MLSLHKNNLSDCTARADVETCVETGSVAVVLSQKDWNCKRISRNVNGASQSLKRKPLISSQRQNKMFLLKV